MLLKVNVANLEAEAEFPDAASKAMRFWDRLTGSTADQCLPSPHQSWKTANYPLMRVTSTATTTRTCQPHVRTHAVTSAATQDSQLQILSTQRRPKAVATASNKIGEPAHAAVPRQVAQGRLVMKA